MQMRSVRAGQLPRAPGPAAVRHLHRFARVHPQWCTLPLCRRVGVKPYGELRADAAAPVGAWGSLVVLRPRRPLSVLL